MSMFRILVVLVVASSLFVTTSVASSGRPSVDQAKRASRLAVERYLGALIGPIDADDAPADVYRCRPVGKRGVACRATARGVQQTCSMRTIAQRVKVGFAVVARDLHCWRT